MIWQIHLDSGLEACHIDVRVVEHILERPDDVELHTSHSGASSLGLLLIVSLEVDLELLTWQKLHGPNAMVHLILDCEIGHETRQVDLLCAVIWKAELYFLMLSKKCFESAQCPRRRDFKGSGVP